MEVKAITEEDLKTIYKWWEAWPGWNPLPRTHLPDNGLGGYIAYSNNQPVVAGFLYNTNSQMILLEWIISDPEYRGEDRKQCIENLILKCQEISKLIGKKTMFSIGRNKNLINTHEKLGWHVDNTPSYEMIKNL